MDLAFGLGEIQRFDSICLIAIAGLAGSRRALSPLDAFDRVAELNHQTASLLRLGHAVVGS